MAPHKQILITLSERLIAMRAYLKNKRLGWGAYSDLD